MLSLTFTTAGLTKFTAAQAGDDIDLTVATVGVTAAEFVVAPTLTTLPGEIKRIDTISGSAVDDSIVHMTMHDTSTDAYAVRGLGLYLADGTLFAVYGQAAPIVEKSSVSTTLLALDIKFPAGAASLIEFGDTNFLYPPATEQTKGVAQIASQAEIDLGTDDLKIVTPRKLAQRLLAIFNRKILTSGLATGGGNLSADRTIDVPAASMEEASAGEIGNKAVTPASLIGLIGRIQDRALASNKVWGGGLATGGGDLSQDRTITVTGATGAETLAGEANDKAVTPLGLAFTLFSRNIFGAGLASGGGNLLADRTITVTGASGAETLAGTANDKVVTPLGLAYTLFNRNVTGTGLASGGGNLTADRTINVAKASSGDVLAASADDKAVTPAAIGGLGRSYGTSGYHVFPGGLILQWGTCIHDAAGNAAVTFPVAFPNAALGATATNSANGAPTAWPGIGGITAAGMNVYAASATGAGPSAPGVASLWLAWGY